LQVALTAVKDAMGAVSYVEFVLHPASMFESFVSVADKVLEAIQPAGGAQESEPRQQVRHSKAWHGTTQPHCSAKTGQQQDLYWSRVCQNKHSC